ncbi:uncharacterized protein LOC115981170 [Quercus lobata]|uniref:uncharacterized protein LOC115981170 n=1 Tax=Quercus lobata TaxID=97700 RepID=UPI001243AFC4|nr:uncharacterized protein LOC115981170 [Quercus lobata]
MERRSRGSDPGSRFRSRLTPYLTEDLLEEILSWLPVKSLTRFKCVKNSWSTATFFQNPSFIAKQQRHRLQTNADLVVASCDLMHLGDCPCILILKMLILKEYALLARRRLWRGRESKVVRYPRVPKCPAHLAIQPSPCNPTGTNAGITQSCNVVHVYDLSTGFWRQIMNSVSIDHSNITLLDYCNFVFLNGVHHWYGSSVTDDNGNHSLPQRDSTVFSFMKELALFNNCLALIVFNACRKIPEKYFNIWVMREYGFEYSWTKKLVVGSLEGIRRPLGFVRNEELILLRDNEDHTVALYIGSQEMKNLQHSGLRNSFYPRCALLYVESLVSLNSGNVF